jgi:hypothetical protein
MLDDLVIVIDDGNPRPGLPIRPTEPALRKFHAKMSFGSARVVVKVTRISQPDSFGFLFTETTSPSAASGYPKKRA